MRSLSSLSSSPRPNIALGPTTEAAARLFQSDQGAGRWCEDIRAVTFLRVVSIQPARNKAKSSFPVFK